MTVCEGLLPFETIECPRDFDDPLQTSCCPDFQGCCYPDAANILAVESEVNPTVHYAFTAVTVVILLFAVVFLCCDSSDPSSSKSNSDEEYLLVRHDSRPILFRTVSSELENDRTLTILSDRGELHPIAPPFDNNKTQLHSMPLNDVDRYPPSRITNYGTQSLGELPPPYMESAMMTPESSLLVLDTNGELMTSTIPSSRYGDIHPEISNHRPLPFAP